MKNKILLLITAAMALGVFASPVTPLMAIDVANYWGANNSGFGAGETATGEVLAEYDSVVTNMVLWYQVPMMNGGMLVVAPRTEIEPVIMSLEKNSGRLPDLHPLRKILTKDMRRRLEFLGFYTNTTSQAANNTPSPQPVPGNSSGQLLKSFSPFSNSAAQSSAANSSTGSNAQSSSPRASSAGGEIAKQWGRKKDSKWQRMMKPQPVKATDSSSSRLLKSSPSTGSLKSSPSSGLLKASSSSGLLKASPEIGLTTIDVNIKTIEGFEPGGKYTHWTQSGTDLYHVYNYYTPMNAVCGCGATALSALAQFYKVPSVLAYSRSCSINTICQKYDTIDGEIDWSILPENFGGDAPAVAGYNALSEEQRELLGRVTYNAGVGLGMQWTTYDDSGSLAIDTFKSLKNVFGFKHARTTFFKDDESPNEEAMNKLLYNQLRAGHPCPFSIAGHAVLAVGFGLDDDNVERVRVFMGWSGMGDGWYALPKVDVSTVFEGSDYLSDVVTDVTTMIAYDDDDIVPVVGKVSVPGATLRIEALDRDIESDENGYFATRVPVDLPAADCVITCEEKQATFQISSVSKLKEPAPDITSLKEIFTDEVAPCLPEALNFVIMDATVAYSLAEAKEKALAEGKAILRLSGKIYDQLTIDAMDYIRALDADNTDGFCDKFVFLFSTARTREGDGSDLSYGVYMPQNLTVKDGWALKNGALTYAYVISDDDKIEFRTSAPALSAPRIDAFNMSDLEDGEEMSGDITTAMYRSIDDVINLGAKYYMNHTSGITLDVTATLPVLERKVTNDVSSVVTASTITNSYSAGDTIELSAPQELTNTVNGTIVYECKGWKLLNKTTSVETTGTECNVSFTVENDGKYLLTWDYSAIKYVYVNVAVTSSGRDLLADKPDLVTPQKGWYPYGEAVMFTSLNEVKKGAKTYIFKNTNIDDPTRLAIRPSTLTVLLPCLEPAGIAFLFEPSSANPNPPADENLLTFDIAWDENLKEVSMYDKGRNVSNKLDVTTFSKTLLTKSQMDALGMTAESLQDVVTTPEGFKAKVEEDEDGNMVAKLDLDKEVLNPVAPEGVSSPITIFPNDDGTLTVKADVRNGVKGFTYSLFGTDDLAVGDWALIKTDFIEGGIPSQKALETPEQISLKIDVEPDRAKRFFKLVVHISDEPAE